MTTLGWAHNCLKLPQQQQQGGTSSNT